jgi:nitrate reductase (cytochrome), electron transfer subunit
MAVVLIASIAIAAVGLISGVEGTTRHVTRAQPIADSTARTDDSRSYRDMQARDYGPNGRLPPSWFETIQRPPDLLAPVVQTDAERAGALELRAGRRAFDGAPPTIPHPVDQYATPACIACHETGARVGGLVAPKMSHARRDSCLQCHVVAADAHPARTAPPAPETTFVGARPARGERAWTGAPPTIPHTTWMRDHCDSCHGTNGKLGMRTTHPWRTACQQCHTPSATLDQRPAMSGGAP